MKARQGRLAEAEVDARRALLSQLKKQGKYNPRHATIHRRTCRHHGRARPLRGRRASWRASALDISGPSVSPRTPVTARRSVAARRYPDLQRKDKEAARSMRRLDKAIAKWEPRAAAGASNSTARAFPALYASGQIEAGIAAAQGTGQALRSPVSVRRHFDAAVGARHAGGRPMRAGRDDDAVREFRAAIPILMAASRENADDDDDHGQSPRAASGCRASSKPISAAGARTERVRRRRDRNLQPWPTPSAAVRCNRRWRRRAPAASSRTRRWPNSCATNRTSASR